VTVRVTPVRPSHGTIAGMPITLYKHANNRKGRYCAICFDRTHGPAERVDLGYGVRLWLCAQHASTDFARSRSGRDFERTVAALFDAAGCLDERRSRAIKSYVARISAAVESNRRQRPGSYAWRRLRIEAEQRFRAGQPATTVARTLRARHAGGVALPPSERTVERWYRERRWLLAPAGSP
jgi:hypothetical protein